MRMVLCCSAWYKISVGKLNCQKLTTTRSYKLSVIQSVRYSSSSQSKSKSESWQYLCCLMVAIPQIPPRHVPPPLTVGSASVQCAGHSGVQMCAICALSKLKHNCIMQCTSHFTKLCTQHSTHKVSAQICCILAQVGRGHWHPPSLLLERSSINVVSIAIHRTVVSWYIDINVLVQQHRNCSTASKFL